MRHGRTAFFFLIAAAALIGCGGGSGDGGVTDGGGSSTVTADFLADDPSPPVSTVTLQKGPVSANLVTVRVDATGVANVYGAAFELTFDGTLAEYVGFTAGSFFEQGGHGPTYQVSSPNPGLVVVGVTRNGSVPGVGVVGSKPIVNLTFRVKTPGSGAVALPDAVLYDAQIPPQRIPNINWEAGTLRGN